MSRTFFALTMGLAVLGCGRNDSGTKPESKAGGDSKSKAAPQADAGDKHYQQLEGTWMCVTYELNGLKVPEDLFQGHGLIFEGKHYIRLDAAGKTKGTYKLDPDKSPKTIDMTNAEGPGKGDTVPGIYELSGDTLRICLAVGSEERPKEFVSKKGSGDALQVLKREKPKEAGKPTDSPTPKEAPEVKEAPAVKEEAPVLPEPGKLKADLPTPATVAEATKIIDLRRFPKLPGAEVIQARTALVSYRTIGELTEAGEFYRQKLAGEGWAVEKESLPGLDPESHTQLGFLKAGFYMRVLVLKEDKQGKADKNGKYLHVIVTHYGNVDVRQLPRPDNAKLVHGFHGILIFTTSGTVAETAESCRKQIIALGWKEEADATSNFESPDYMSLRLVNNGLVLRVPVSVQAGKTTVHYEIGVLDK